MWIFNLLFQLLAPVVDIMVLVSLFREDLRVLLLYALAFWTIDSLSFFIAARIDRESGWQIGWLFLQRFFYRQFMYYIIVRALWLALRGGIARWGKLPRKDTAVLAPTEAPWDLERAA
jgi:hypothetical protein